MMSRHGAVLFLSAMSAFLFREGFPFVLVSPSRLHTTKNSNPVQVVTASSPGCRRSAAGGRAATCSPLSVAAGSSQLRRKRQDKGMWMAGARVPDLWNGDSIPTPGWVRMAQRNMARIKPGDQLPDVAVSRLDDDGNVRSFSVKELFGDKKGVLIGVPGAFSPSCAETYLPEFVEKSSELATKGIELVAFVAVNDVFVMKAWEEARGAKGKVLMLSDGNGDLSAAMGMMVDLTHRNMGLRCQQFACVVEGGRVTHTRVGNMAGLVSASAVESVLDDVNFGNAIDGSGSGREGGLFEKLLGKEVASRRAAKEAEEKKSDDLLLPA